MIKFFLLALLILLQTSCSPIMMGLLGIKQPKVINKNELPSLFGKFNIDEGNSFLPDTSKADSFLKKLIYEEPLQLICFDSKQRIIFHILQCDVTSIFNLNWNRKKSFDNYPPTEYISNKKILDFNSTDIIQVIMPKFDVKLFNQNSLNIIVFWNSYMNRQTKRLVSFVKRYKLNSPLDFQIGIFYVNTDYYQ